MTALKGSARNFALIVKYYKGSAIFCIVLRPIPLNLQTIYADLAQGLPEAAPASNLPSADPTFAPRHQAQRVADAIRSVGAVRGVSQQVVDDMSQGIMDTVERTACRR
jgi:hypothetical protein